jgi:phosphohistidine phosphatase
VKRLVVLRHAKSSWDEPGLDDHERPLTKRGRKAAEMIGLRLHEDVLAPQLVLCSTALRARETLAGVGRGLDSDVPVQLEPGLYEASLESLVGRVKTLPEEYDIVLLVGHNPGLQELVLHLADGGLAERVQSKLPTGALVTIDFDVVHWADVAPASVRVAAVIFPKDL